MTQPKDDDGWKSLDPMQQQAVSTAMILQQRNREWKLVDAKIGDGLPWDPARVGIIVDNFARVDGMAKLVMGRYLLWAKRNLKHGEWMKWRAARKLPTEETARMMRLAHLFDPRHEKLLKELGIGKLWELYDCSADDLKEYLTEFEETGKLLGKGLDEIDRMPTRELRDALRKNRKHLDKTAKDNARLRAENHRLNQELAAPEDNLKAPEYQIAGRFKLLEKEAHHLFRTCGADKRTVVGAVILDELEEIAGRFSVDYKIWMQDGRVADYKDRLRLPRPAHVRFSQLRDPDWATEAAHRGDDPEEINKRYDEAKKVEPYEPEEEEG